MIRTFAELVQLPEEATDSLEKAFALLSRNQEALSLLQDAMEDYFCGDEPICVNKLRMASEQSGLHPYVVDMLFLILCAKPLRRMYKQKGLPDYVYRDSMADLKYKLLECKRVYGIWGTFVFGWFRGFYLCERFSLGRLQYEKIQFPFDLSLYDGRVKKGSVVYNCHIPSCGPLTAEAVMQSLKKAYAFYGSELHDGVLPVVCLSWLLYPPFSRVFPEGSNLQKFCDLFQILAEYEEPGNPDFWRIFGRNDTADTDSWPEETRLQRRCKAYLQGGGVMGEGYGILMFDGTRICGKMYNQEERR